MEPPTATPTKVSEEEEIKKEQPLNGNNLAADDITDKRLTQDDPGTPSINSSNNNDNNNQQSNSSNRAGVFWRNLRKSTNSSSSSSSSSSSTTTPLHKLFVHSDLPLDGYMAHSALQAGDVIREVHGLDDESSWRTSPQDAMQRMEAQFTTTGCLSLLAERPSPKWTLRRATVGGGGIRHYGHALASDWTRHGHWRSRSFGYGI